MRRAASLLCAVMTICGCSRELVWQPYADASGDFSVEAPKSWPSTHDPNLKRRPVAMVTFLGEETPQDEGRPLGAQIQVSRVTRVASEMPADAKARRKFVEAWIVPPDVLFGAPVESLPPEARENLPKVSDTTLGGKAAKTYEREYEYVNHAHGALDVWIRSVDVVVRTDKAYYMVVYSAPRDRFEKYRPVFERFVKSFAFGPSA